MKRLFCIFSMMLILVPQITYAAASNQPLNWGFKRGANEQPAEAGAQLDTGSRNES